MILSNSHKRVDFAKLRRTTIAEFMGHLKERTRRLSSLRLLHQVPHQEPLVSNLIAFDMRVESLGLERTLRYLAKTTLVVLTLGCKHLQLLL